MRTLRGVGRALLLVTFLCLAGAASASAAPPANDSFASAAAVSLGSSTPASNVEATKEVGEPNHAGDADGQSVWFNWTPIASGPALISTCTPTGTLDAVLAVYTGSAVDALTPVASDDDGLGRGTQCRGTDGEVRFEAVKGTTYRIAVDGTDGTVGPFALLVHAPPANDSFASPRVLGPSRNSGTGLVDNELATRESGEPDHAGVVGGHSTWFSWTPTEAGPVTFSACPLSREGPLDAVLGVYTGSAVDALAEVASSAGESDPGCGPFGAQATFDAEAGTTYRIAVDGSKGSEGEFQLELAGGAANDAFANAQALQPEPTIANAGNTRTASAEPGEPKGSAGSTGHSLWFRWTAPSSGPLVLTACPDGEFEGAPTLALYTGQSLGALAPVASDDAGGSYCGPEASQVEIDAVANAEYKLAVDAKGGAGGPFSLGIEGLPANDDFAAPQVVPAEPTVAYGSTRFATKEPGEPDHAGDPGGHSTWFSWTPTKSGRVAILACPGRTTGPHLSPGGIATVLGVYTGSSLGALAAVASNAGGPVTETVNCRLGGVEGASEVRFDVVAGTTYKIAVDAVKGGEGPFTLAFERGPSNDSLAGAQQLSAALPAFGFVRDGLATKEPGEPAIAGDPGGHSTWFSWTAPASGPVLIGTCTGGGALDSLLGVYTGETIAALVPVASDDDGPPLQAEGCRSTDSSVEIEAVAGTTYKIAVDGKDGTVGTTNLQLEGTPADDDFDHPVSLGARRRTQFSGSNRFASSEAGEPTETTGGHSIWFKWTAPHDGEYSLDTCGSTIDTLLGVYVGGAVGSLTTVASDDNGGGECSPASRLTFIAPKGTVFRFAIDGKGGAEGTVVLHLDDVPGNDAFGAAEAIPTAGGYASGSTALATAEAGEPSLGGRSIWYSWTASRSGPASLEACGTGFAPALAVFTGTQAGALSAVPVSGAGSGTCHHGTAVDFTAVAGTTYRIQVGGSEGGRVQLHLISAASRLRLLTVRTDGAGAVSLGSGGTACGAKCRLNLAAGTPLTLVAEPAPGSTFLGWSGGGCSGASSCTVDVHGDATVIASFGPAPPKGETPPAETPPSTPPSSGSSSPGGSPSGGGSASPGAPPSGAAPGGGSTPPGPGPAPSCRKGFKRVHRGGKAICVKKPAKPAHPKKHHKKHRG